MQIGVYPQISLWEFVFLEFNFWMDEEQHPPMSQVLLIPFYSKNSQTLILLQSLIQYLEHYIFIQQLNNKYQIFFLKSVPTVETLNTSIGRVVLKYCTLYKKFAPLRCRVIQSTQHQKMENHSQRKNVTFSIWYQNLNPLWTFYHSSNSHQQQMFLNFGRMIMRLFLEIKLQNFSSLWIFL